MSGSTDMTALEFSTLRPIIRRHCISSSHKLRNKAAGCVIMYLNEPARHRRDPGLQNRVGARARGCSDQVVEILAVPPVLVMWPGASCRVSQTCRAVRSCKANTYWPYVGACVSRPQTGRSKWSWSQKHGESCESA